MVPRPDISLPLSGLGRVAVLMGFKLLSSDASDHGKRYFNRVQTEKRVSVKRKQKGNYLENGKSKKPQLRKGKIGKKEEQAEDKIKQIKNNYLHNL